MRKILLVGFVLTFSLFLLTPLFAGGMKMGVLPAPTLLAPSDNADITGKETLEFRWTPEGDRSNLRYYDFRLYQGHQTVESGLLLKKEIPAGQTSVQIETSLFHDGQTYAWSLREVGQRKSRSNYSVF